MLDKIIEEVCQLPPNEQRQLQKQLRSIIPSSSTEDELEEEIERRLVAEGLIRVPPAGQPPSGEFQRIDVGGQPMSKMIIEERR